MQTRQSAMSAQLPMALLHPSASNSGHTLGQEIPLRLSSSPPAPHVLSAPPHFPSRTLRSSVSALASDAAVLGSVMQSVAGGSFPLCFASSHFASSLSRAAANAADALLMPR